MRSWLGSLRALATEAAGKLDVLGLDGHTLGCERDVRRDQEQSKTADHEWQPNWCPRRGRQGRPRRCIGRQTGYRAQAGHVRFLEGSNGGRLESQIRLEMCIEHELVAGNV
jgi:hypothetical protein